MGKIHEQKCLILINYYRKIGGMYMYYYGGYSGYGCGNNACYPTAGCGCGNGYGAAIILVLFILLVIIIGARAWNN